MPLHGEKKTKVQKKLSYLLLFVQHPAGLSGAAAPKKKEKTLKRTTEKPD